MQNIAADANRRAKKALREKEWAESRCASTKAQLNAALDRESVLYNVNASLKIELESKAASQRKNESYKLELQSNATLISSLKAEVKTSSTEISKLKNEKTDTAGVVKKLRECISRLEKQKAESTQAQKTSIDKISSLTARAKEQGESIQSLRKDVDSKTNTIAELETGSEQARKSASDRAAALNAGVKERDEKIRSLQKDKESKEDSIGSLTRRLAGLEAEGKCKDKTIGELSAQISDLKAKSLQDESKVEELSKEILGYKATKEKLEDEAASSKIYIESLETEDRRKDKVKKDLEAQVSELKAKISKAKGKAKATKDDKLPTTRPAIPAHPTGSNDVHARGTATGADVDVHARGNATDADVDVHARGSATEADVDVTAPPKVRNATSTAELSGSKPLVPTAVPSTEGDHSLAGNYSSGTSNIATPKSETPKVVASKKEVPSVETPAKGSAKVENVSRVPAKNWSEDEEMTDAFGDPAPEGPKGDDEMDIDQQTPTTAGHAGRVTHNAGRPPVTEVPKAGFSILNGIRGAPINSAAILPNRSSESTEARPCSFDLAHATTGVFNGAPGSSNLGGIKPDLDRSIAKVPIGAAKPSIFDVFKFYLNVPSQTTKVPIGASKPSIVDGFKFDLSVPSQPSAFHFDSSSPTPATTKPKGSSFNPSMRPAGPSPSRSPHKPRRNYGVQRVEGSLGDFKDPGDGFQHPSHTDINVGPATTHMPSTLDDNKQITEVKAASGEELRKEATEWFNFQEFHPDSVDGEIQWGKFETEMQQYGFEREQRLKMFRYA